MEEVYEFLKKCGVYYLATVDGDQPRVRPFGTANVFEYKLYIQTGKSKSVSKQIGSSDRGRDGQSDHPSRTIRNADHVPGRIGQ